jgi:hypothetical protein
MTTFGIRFKPFLAFIDMSKYQEEKDAIEGQHTQYSAFILQSLYKNQYENMSSVDNIRSQVYNESGSKGPYKPIY